jgi:hypothetical protein
MNFKSKEAAEGFELMHPAAQSLAKEMDEWSRDRHGVELVFTETFTTPEEDKKLGRVSDTHRTGRAFDIRTSDLSKEFIHDFIQYFTTLYPNLGAISGKSGKPNLIHYKPHGTGPHFHVQIRRGI